MTWQIITTVFIGRFASLPFDRQLILRLLGFPVAAAADPMSGEPSAGGISWKVATRIIAATVAATMLMADDTLPSHAAEGRVTAAAAKRAMSETNASACGLNPGSASLASRPAHPLVDAEECALKPMDRFKECDDCPEMVVIPAGSFKMGSPRNEYEMRGLDEGPQHRVVLSKPFAVGRFSVTFDEWDRCVADGGCKGYRPEDNGWGRGRRPVINVSWDDAKAYVTWLSSKTHKNYRLPSEAEREYVTRAGTTTPFWWGASILTKQANYDGRSTYGQEPKGEYRGTTVPVDSFAPNPWGLYQIHGNVWEWTEDCYHDSYAGAPTDGVAVLGSGGGNRRWIAGGCYGRRAARGGSWDTDPWELRSAARDALAPESRTDGVSFRVTREL
jgi:formylglycine-generating enzyme required for sulfatase activity